jgi:hypothetical protein
MERVRETIFFRLRPSAADIFGKLSPPLRASRARVQRRDAGEQGSHDLRLLEHASGRKLIAGQRIVSLHQSLENFASVGTLHGELSLFACRAKHFG